MGSLNQGLISNIPNYRAIILANFGPIFILSLVYLAIVFLRNPSDEIRAHVLALSLVVSAMFVSFGLLPEKSAGWRSVAASMVFAVATWSVAIGGYAYLSGARASSTDWAFSETVLFCCLGYTFSMLSFYFMNMLGRAFK